MINHTYAAAIITPSHLIFFRGEEYRRLSTDSPESEMVTKAFAFKRSIRE
jgi:hypothetical protein